MSKKTKELTCTECGSLNVSWRADARSSYFECKDCQHKFGRVTKDKGSKRIKGE